MTQANLTEGSTLRGTNILSELMINSRVRDLGNSDGSIPSIDDAPLQLIDPGGGNVNFDLPDPTNFGDGTGNDLVFIIANTADAAETLTIRNSSGTIVTTNGSNVVVGQGQVGLLVYNGGSWYGWDLG